MLIRQRTLLYLFQSAGGCVSHLQATKWAFVLAHDTESGGGDTFYDFLPYKFGPFSFSLYQEAGKLCGRGLLEEADSENWELTSNGERQIGNVPSAIKKDVHRVLAQYGGVSSSGLMKKIYKRHPWFTILSEVERHQERPMGEPGAYSAGYEGLSVDAFLNRLLRNGISRVIDVRRNPVARRYGFHRKTLAGLCNKLEIEYRHFPRLGIATDKRRQLSTYDDYDRLFKEYEHTTLVHEKAPLQEVAKLMTENPSVLICSEADPSFCHRTRVANKVSEMTGLAVHDLGDR